MILKKIFITCLNLTFIFAGCGETDHLKPPNIILIIVDDMGYGVPGCYGGNEISTPNIDRMAEEGKQFFNAYSGSSLCAPSRSALLLGKHNGHTSLRGNTGGISILKDDITFTDVLSKAGYTVGGFGKWGLGDAGTPGAPEKHGFDIFFGYYHQIHAHFFYTDYLWQNGSKVPILNEHNNPESYSHNIIVNKMKEFIKEQAITNKPFFCLGSWTPPHTDDDGNPQIPTSDPAYKHYEDSELSEIEKQFAAMHTKVDYGLGEILKLLKDLEIDNNTLVIFTSDNGGGGEWLKHFQLNGEYRGYKRTLYEGGLKVPFVARWPNKIEAGSKSDLVFYFPDLMPTFAEISNASELLPDDIDGISIVPALLGESRQNQHDFLYWEIPDYDWSKKYYPENALQQAVRKGKWKMVRHFQDEPWELYNLDLDPEELNNVSDSNKDVVKDLAELINNNRTDMIEQIEPEMPEGKWYR